MTSRRLLVAAALVLLAALASVGFSAWSRPRVAGPLLAGPVQVRLGADTLLVDTDPAACGTNALHLSITDAAGRLVVVEQARVTLQRDGDDPRPLRLLPAGPGRFLTVALSGADGGTRGRWLLRFSARAAGRQVSAVAPLTLS